MRTLGYSGLAGGMGFLGLAIFVLVHCGFNGGFFGALLAGGVGIASGFNLIGQSKGSMD